MRLIVTNYSSAVDLGVMFGQVAICFKVGQEDYGKQCTRGVRRMKCYLPQLPWPGTQEVAWRLTGLSWGWAVLVRCFSSCVHPTGQRRQNSLWSGKRWDLSSVGAARLDLGRAWLAWKWCTIRHCWWAKAIYDNSWSATSPGFTLKS